MADGHLHEPVRALKIFIVQPFEADTSRHTQAAVEGLPRHRRHPLLVPEKFGCSQQGMVGEGGVDVWLGGQGWGKDVGSLNRSTGRRAAGRRGGGAAGAARGAAGRRRPAGAPSPPASRWPGPIAGFRP